MKKVILTSLFWAITCVTLNANDADVAMKTSGAVAKSQPSGANSPEAVARAIAKLVPKGDIDGILSFIELRGSIFELGNPRDIGLFFLREFAQNCGSIKHLGLTPISRNAQTAVLRVSVDCTKGAMQGASNVRFINQNGIWKVDATSLNPQY